MRTIFFTIAILLFCCCCKSSDSDVAVSKPQLTVLLETGATGYIYLDGSYTGKRTPDKIVIGPGKHVVGVADPISAKYYRKEVAVSESAELRLSEADVPAPRKWKALWIGIRVAENPNGGSTHFSTEQLDAAFDFFKWSITEQFEKYSFGVTSWDVDRTDVAEPVKLQQSGNNQIITFQSIKEKVPAVSAGAYDCVFVFFRQQEGSVVHVGNYFGLAWTDPLRDTEKMGFVIVKFDMGSSIQDKISSYKANDPGLFIHEWLHTVGENFYPSVGVIMPEVAGDGLRIHAAEIYGYSFPWISWYKDIMAGKVLKRGGSGYCGIGPEALLNNSLRKVALEGR